MSSSVTPGGLFSIERVHRLGSAVPAACEMLQMTGLFFSIEERLTISSLAISNGVFTVARRCLFQAAPILLKLAKGNHGGMYRTGTLCLEIEEREARIQLTNGE